MKLFISNLLFFFFFLPNLSAQNCLPGFNFFTTQEQIDSFPIHYQGCHFIEGSLQIGDFGTNITHLDSLYPITSIEGDLIIFYNENISNFNGLQNLASVGQNLNIKLNSVNSMEGLEGLISVGGDFIINDNDSLVNLIGLEKINFVGNELFIFENEKLVDLQGLENLTSMTGLRVHDNILLQNFEGLNNVEKIDGSFDIVSNEALINFEGLENVDSITGNFYVQSNDKLSGLEGLNNLKYCGKNFTLRNNKKLLSLEPLQNLKFIGGPSLNISYNEILKSLSGIDNVEMSDLNSVSNIYFEYSDSLSFCSVRSVCDYLLAGGWYSLVDNKFGCNSSGEIFLNCDFTSTKNLEKEKELKIIPNPSFGKIEIEGLEELNGEIEIFNTIGQLVFSKSINGKSEFDLIFLPKGNYFLTIKSKEKTSIKKLILL